MESVREQVKPGDIVEVSFEHPKIGGCLVVAHSRERNDGSVLGHMWVPNRDKSRRFRCVVPPGHIGRVVGHLAQAA